MTGNHHHSFLSKRLALSHQFFVMCGAHTLHESENTAIFDDKDLGTSLVNFYLKKNKSFYMFNVLITENSGDMLW